MIPEAAAGERERSSPSFPACKFGVGEASVDEIEQFNILRAAQLAMRAANPWLDACAHHRRRQPPAELSFPRDASWEATDQPLHRRRFHHRQVTRDRMMKVLAESFPGYGWERNVGYPTPEHRAALRRLGLTPHHRRTFRAVYEVLATTY
jgi:ribonuclease HII